MSTMRAIGAVIVGLVKWAVALGLAYAFLMWVTAVPGDQVCRTHGREFQDWLHGMKWQPTCDKLIDDLDARLSAAQSKNDELEGRVSDLETKLGM